MPKIAFATYLSLPSLSDNDRLLVPIFKENGFEIKAEIWDDESVDWFKYDAVIIRSTWDYFLKSEKFLSWISKFKNTKTQLFNSPEVVLNNTHKFYLKSLQQKGVSVIPTWFSSQKILIEELKGIQKIVIKPAVSGGSYETEVFETKLLSQEILDKKIKQGDWLIQPFLSQIKEYGELSLIFLGGEYSHSIRKIPKKGDFRVQKQFGATYNHFEPDLKLIEKAKNIVQLAAENTLYARVDGLEIENEFLLMEIEMIEPDLFFEYTKTGPLDFVNATIKYMKN